ncbi:integrase [Desulfurivibrio sp. D14AmB]|uniref:integrase n=1 Tax=Desulfurivibrio sp. D14AmB TaxID=3374370 RepID=UPI00376F2B2B
MAGLTGLEPATSGVTGQQESNTTYCFIAVLKKTIYYMDQSWTTPNKIGLTNEGKMATFDKRGPYQIRARIRKRGHGVITKTFNNMSDARAWALEVEAALNRDDYIPATAARATTVREALNRYRDEIFPRLAAGGEFEKARVQRLIEALGDLSLSALDTAHVAQYRDKQLKAGLAAQTVKHDLGLLNRVLKCCVMDWGIPLPRGIVTAQVRKPALPNGRDRRLVEDEEERLLAAAEASRSQEIGPIIVIALETGARRGEIQNMTWKHINLAAGTWHIPITKTGVPRTVPLTNRAMEILQARPHRIDGRVWSTQRRDGITQAFTRVCRRAGIENLRFHDLRHEATSRFFERGLNMMEVAAITGHKSLSMLKRYTHLRAEDLAVKLRAMRQSQSA